MKGVHQACCTLNGIQGTRSIFTELLLHALCFRKKYPPVKFHAETKRCCLHTFPSPQAYFDSTKPYLNFWGQILVLNAL